MKWMHNTDTSAKHVQYTTTTFPRCKKSSQEDLREQADGMQQSVGCGIE